jgi:glycosyltransferase involved in cell wall biosynthesis
MSEPLFSVISWVNNQKLYREMMESFDGVDCEFIELGQEYESMAQAYNAGTEKAKGKYFVYCHQDARLIDPEFTSKVIKTFALHPDIGIMGVAGTINNNQRSVWFKESANSYLGGIKEHGDWICFGQTDCMARTIDAVFMVTDKRLMFPEILPGIHLLDAWVCRQTEDLGYYNWVCDIKVQHLSPGNPNTQSFQDNLGMYRWYWYQGKNNGDVRVHHAKLLPELSIVIAVYNNIFCTKNLLEQLKTEAPGAEIIIVNNASTDSTRQWLNTQSGVKVIDNTKNEGVSRAWNAGLNQATGKVMAVLNNDIELFPGGISRLYAEALKCGISCASMMKNNSNFCGGTKTYHVANSDYANGEALFFRRDVWLNIGEFDESYEMAYYEDTDWSCRARLKGYTWSGVNNTMKHLQAQTSKLIPGIQHYISRNQALFVDRYKHIGFGLHIALHFNGPTHNAINALKQIKETRKNLPLSRIYVYCQPEYNVLFDTPEVDYVGLPNDSLECNQNIVLQHLSTHVSPVIGAYTPKNPARVLVGTLMCDRKRDSQMVNLDAIDKLEYDNFDVYINIQSSNPTQEFANVYKWAKQQEGKGRRVYIDTWDWNSGWARSPEFDQDNARLIPICIARNTMLQAASSMDYDYLLQIDNDVIVPSNSIEKLMAEERPIVGGLVPGRGVHSHATYLTNVFGNIDANKLIVSYATCGFVLLRRDVFEYMRYRTGCGVRSTYILSEDPAFFDDADVIWGFGKPVILTDLFAQHWDNPNAPLTEEGTPKEMNVVK